MVKYCVYISVLVVLLMPCSAYAKGIDIAADTMTRDEHGVVIAKGDVEIKRQGETLKTDELHYDIENKRIQAIGHVEVLSPKAHIQAESASFQKRGASCNMCIPFML